MWSFDIFLRAASDARQPQTACHAMCRVLLLLVVNKLQKRTKVAITSFHKCDGAKGAGAKDPLRLELIKRADVGRRLALHGGWTICRSFAEVDRGRGRAGTAAHRLECSLDGVADGGGALS